MSEPESDPAEIALGGCVIGCGLLAFCVVVSVIALTIKLCLWIFQ